MLHRMLGLLLLDDTSPAHAGSDRIAEAIRYMNRHLFEELSVQEVAASVSLSSSHFSRQFKAKTGYSPYEYIILRRIDKAKYLLTSTPLSVKEIAYATGYNSEENFIHSFRSNVGIAPACSEVPDIRLSKNYRFPIICVLTSQNTGRPKVPMRKLSPSRSIKTEVHAPGFYGFTSQSLLNARCRAAAAFA